MDMHVGLLALSLTAVPVSVIIVFFTYAGYTDSSLREGFAAGVFIGLAYAVVCVFILSMIFKYDHGYLSTLVSERELFEIPVEAENPIYIVNRIDEKGFPDGYAFSTQKVSILNGLESLDTDEQVIITSTNNLEPVLKEFLVSKVCDPADWVQEWLGICTFENNTYFEFLVPGAGIYTETAS